MSILVFCLITVFAVVGSLFTIYVVWREDTPGLDEAYVTNTRCLKTTVPAYWVLLAASGGFGLWLSSGWPYVAGVAIAIIIMVIVWGFALLAFIMVTRYLIVKYESEAIERRYGL